MDTENNKTTLTKPEAVRHTTPPALGKVRLADLDDIPQIFDLCNDSMKQTFRITGPEQIEFLIENAVLSITQLNISSEIVGFLSVREYPLIPSVHPAAWEEYIWTKYKTMDMNARNTLWIHLICWDKRYSREIVDFMMSTIFMHDAYVLFLGMMKSILSCPLQELVLTKFRNMASSDIFLVRLHLELIPGTLRAEGAFRRVQAMERGMSGDRLPAMLIAERKEVCPRLRVRRAVEEDNDDIVPIIERHSKRLRDLYGDYYVSEMIRYPESDRIIFVCEHKEVAVGVMCLNTQINFESLEECFELSPYAGLRHLDQPPHKHRISDKDNINNSCVSVSGGDAICDSSYNLDTISNIEATKSRSAFDAQVTWSSKEEDAEATNKTNQSGRSILYAIDDGRPIGTVSILEFLDLFNDEEEEVEFDIVNIDPEFLRLPPDLMSANDDISKNMVDGRKKDKEPVDDILVPRKEKKRSIASTSMSKPPDYIIRYSGTSNAVLIELYAMELDYDERFAYDMLEAVYELFPNRDYCCICLPSNHAPLPLLEHFTLVTPHSTHMRFINESLYIAHINSVRGNVSVRPAEPADLDGMFNLLEHAPRRHELTPLFEQSLVSKSLESYMFLAENQPIGFAIVGPLEDGTSIRVKYDLLPEPKRPGTDGNILACVMSPVMEAHGRWYLRDIMRQSRFSTLFWICQPFARGEQGPTRNMMSLAERMVPVRPRLSMPNLTGNKDLDRLYKELVNPFALWIIEKPLSVLPKVFVNNGIVVVGASRTGLAFIETLIMGLSAKYLTFTNLTLVSEYGLPTVAECLKAADTCIPREGRYSDSYLKSMPFCFYVDVIPAVVTAIDRKKKCIYFSGGGTKNYDELVLTCGQQFQHPDYLKDSLERAKEVRKGKPCERILMDNPKYQPDRVPPPPEIPQNLFLINSLLQANLVLRRLLRMIADQKQSLSHDNPIVVYGDRVEAYCCMSALIELGVAGYEIVFVENFPSEDTTALRVNCFNDEVIDERVQEKLESVGVRVLRMCRLVSLHLKGNSISFIGCMDPLHSIKQRCFALFYFGLKSIDIHAFKAINECGLVYDGGLVVGPLFETNDPFIFGAGTCCNYSRRLYGADNNHKYYASEDVGEALAKMFLRRLDPFVACHPEYTAGDFLPRYDSMLYRQSHASIPEVTFSRLHLTAPGYSKWEPVMKFDAPIVIFATLPGPLYYMKVRKPGQDIPMEVQLNLPHQGHTLVTDKNGNYFRVRLNVFHCVNAIVCLSKQPLTPEVLVQLYGKHEAFFNKLLLRYQLGQIDDLYNFFVQPWMAAMYQETFVELLSHINYHEIGAIYDVMRSRYAMYGNESKPSKLVKPFRSTCFDEPECEEVAAKKLGTFRSVISKYVVRTSSQMERMGPTDIPAECGQSPSMREEVAGFWNAVGGDKIVFSHMGRHIAKYGVTNPQYAPVQPALY